MQEIPSKWHSYLPIQEQLLNGVYPEFNAEVDRIYNSPVARQDRSWDNVARCCLKGKIGEIALRFFDRKIVDLDESSLLAYGQNNPNFLKLKNNIIYNDCIHKETGEVYEVKFWLEKYVDDVNSSEWLKLRQKIKEKQCLFPDHIVIFARRGQQIKFHKAWTVQEILELG